MIGADAQQPGRPAGSGPAGKSRIIGDLKLSGAPTSRTRDRGLEAASPEAASPEAASPEAEERVDVVLELNAGYPGSLADIRAAFRRLWSRFERRWGHPEPLLEPVPLSRRHFQCVLTREALALLLDLDRPTADTATSAGHIPVIARAWPDYSLYPQIDRSAPTVKVDAARRSFNTTGAGIVWAVVDTGIDADHPHFAALELAREGKPGAAPCPRTGGLHRDFSHLVRPSVPGGPVTPSPLTDEEGHGTHVAGIIAGASPPGSIPHVASSDEAADGGFVPRQHTGELAGMAPMCELVSIKVFRRINGVAVTSSAALIAAIDYLLTEVNLSRWAPGVHGVNLSLGCEWDPSHYAAGQSPVCQLLDELVASGVNVVVSAGNTGQAAAAQSANQSVGVLASITEPGHAQGCITVGSTHRDAPHVFGVSWTSSKGPTLDGRAKPDVVAPGEWICSAATGTVRTKARLDGLPAPDPLLTYAEQSGTSMAAPHVSGILAGFLSSRPAYIGRPTEVKALLTRTALDLGRDRYAQGAGLADAMRMLTDS